MKYDNVNAVRLVVGGLCMLLLLVGCAAPDMEPTDAVMQSADDAVTAVSEISTEMLVGKMRVTIHADRDLTYTAFKLNDPLRLVLDLPNVDTTQVAEMTFAQQTPLLRVTPFQFSEGETVNSRIEVALSHLVPYQVFNDANRLFIDLEVPVDAQQPLMAQPSQAQPSQAQPSSSLPPGFEELTTLDTITPVVIDSKPAAMPGAQATQLATMPAAPVSVPTISTDAPVPAGLPTIEIAKPPEVVGDVTTLSQILASPSAISLIKGIEVSEIEGITRIIVNADKTPEFDIKRTDMPPRVTIDLKQSDLPPGAEQVITPEAMDSLVKQVRLFQLRRTPGGTDNVARILVDLMQPTKHQVVTEPGQLILDIEHPAIQLTEAPALEGEDIVEVPLTTGIEEALTAQAQDEAEEEISTSPTIRDPQTGDEKEYKGQLISIHFQQADVLDVLDVIAEVSGLNLVIHPGVSGTVTVRLDNIPWDQALDIILKMNNLAVEIEGNILRIAQAGIFQQEVAQRVNQQRQQIEALQVQEDLQPLETKLITINFAEPGAIVGIINAYFMGANTQNSQDRRGTITVDSRTKTLIIQDTAANIEKIEEIVATLDRRTPQVLIEARIVSLSTTFRKELGINWSGSFNADAAHGNPLGYRFPYTVDVPNFGVNLPTVGNAVGSIPITLGSIDDIITIFARIDAAEENFQAKTLSQPKIFTQDNVGASVTSTQTEYVSVGGDSQTAASIQPVSASLSLNVTPRISRDGFITMQVNVSNGAVGTAAGGGAQTNTQAVNSQVTVKDGETVVIGGIYGTSDQQNFTAVPYLHKIPVIGRLFKSTLPNSKSQSELLVFLTPRILDRSILKPEEGTSAAFSY